MGILYKTYNGQHQLHLYRELWVVKTKQQLNDLLSLFSKKEAAKAQINTVGNQIELELNGLIVDCRDIADLKAKFNHLVELKVKFQKVTPPPKKSRPPRK